MNSRQKIHNHTVEEWVKLYEAGYSTRQIAKCFHVGQRTVWRHLSKIMKLRPSLRDGPKYPKKSFCGDSLEKAYLLGLRYTDLSACKHRRQIQAWLSTSHSAMVNLFVKLFSKYATVKWYPIYKRDEESYEWTVYCFLDSTFEFLVEVPAHPSWVLTNDAVFLSFFAGRIDGDGSISVEQRRNRWWYSVIHFNSENKLLIDCIFQKLKQMGYNPRLRIAQHKGSITYSKYKLTNDLWVLRLGRKNEVINLLEYLPLKLAEKVEKQKIILEGINKSWMELRNVIHELRRTIHNKTNKCITEAQQEHNRRHFPTQNQL